MNQRKKKHRQAIKIMKYCKNYNKMLRGLKDWTPDGRFLGRAFYVNAVLRTIRQLDRDLMVKYKIHKMSLNSKAAKKFCKHIALRDRLIAEYNEKEIDYFLDSRKGA